MVVHACWLKSYFQAENYTAKVAIFTLGEVYDSSHLLQESEITWLILNILKNEASSGYYIDEIAT